MPNNAPKDHYVPQFYLDPFSVEGSGIKNPHIYQYMEDRIAQPRIKDVASEKHFYTFKDKDTGKPNRDVDTFLTQIETRGSIPLKKIINQENLDLTDQEFEELAVFLAMLVVRTPGFIKSQESFREEALKEYHATEAFNKDLLRRKYKKVGIILTEQQLKDQQEFALGKRYTIKFSESRAYFVGMGLEMAVTLAEMYYQIKHWHLIVTSGTEFFITSDNPVSIYRPAYIPPVYSAGYGSGTLIITISPRLALLLRDLPLPNKVIKVNSYFVKKINKNVIRFSDNYIYANQDSKKIHRLFKNTDKGAYQKAKVTRLSWAPFVFIGPSPVPEEIIK